MSTHPETQALLDALATSDGTMRGALPDVLRGLVVLLDALDGEAVALTRSLEAAEDVEADDSVRSVFGRMESTLRTIRRLVQELDRPLRETQTTIRQLARIDAELRGFAERAGYATGHDSKQ